MKETTTARQLAQIWHKVKCSGSPYSKESFKKVGGATGARLYDVLVETRYYDPAIREYVDTFVQASNKRSMKSNVPATWDVDAYARFIDDYVLERADELGIEIIQKRGRKAGISPFKKEKPDLLEDVELPENPQIMEDEVLDEPSESTELDPDILEIANAIRTLKKYNLTVTITF